MEPDKHMITIFERIGEKFVRISDKAFSTWDKAINDRTSYNALGPKNFKTLGATKGCMVISMKAWNKDADEVYYLVDTLADAHEQIAYAWAMGIVPT